MLLSIAYTGRSKSCQREQWFIFRAALSPRIRGCRLVSAVFADRRHYFQQFYLLPELPFGRGRKDERSDTSANVTWNVTGLLSDFILLSRFSPFFARTSHERVILCVIAIQPGVPGLRFNNRKRPLFQPAPDGLEKQVLMAWEFLSRE